MSSSVRAPAVSLLCRSQLWAAKLRTVTEQRVQGLKALMWPPRLARALAKRHRAVVCLRALSRGATGAYRRCAKLTSKTLPKGLAPKPSTDTRSPVLPSARCGIAGCDAAIAIACAYSATADRQPGRGSRNARLALAHSADFCAWRILRRWGPKLPPARSFPLNLRRSYHTVTPLSYTRPRRCYDYNLRAHQHY